MQIMLRGTAQRCGVPTELYVYRYVKLIFIDCIALVKQGDNRFGRSISVSLVVCCYWILLILALTLEVIQAFQM